MSGEVSLDEIDENLEVIKYPGIYLAGELLDVDGDCGGYLDQNYSLKHFYG